jgi:enterochelin esterase-like enzyme
MIPISTFLRLVSAIILILASGALAGTDHLSQLRFDFKRGDKKLVLREFWKKIANHGGPLVQELSEKPGHVAVTFLWRDKNKSEQVRLVSDMSREPFGEPMERISETDIWFRTEQILKGASILYGFIAGPPPEFNPAKEYPELNSQQVRERFERELARVVPDPLNKTSVGMVGPSDRHEDYQSVFKANVSSIGIKSSKLSILELPGFQKRLWISKKKFPLGTLRGYEFPVSVAKADSISNRRIAIYLPSSYSPKKNKRYPLAIIFDGEDALNEAHISTILDNLIANGAIRPVIAVFISIENGRNDLSAKDTYINFLSDHFLPYLQNNYHVSNKAKDIMIAGFSKGGYAATSAGIKRPDVFGNILRADGSFPELWPRPDPDFETTDQLLAKIDTNKANFRQPQKYFITYSELLEDSAPPDYPIKKYRPAFENLSKKLSDGGSNVTLRGYKIGHNMIHFQIAFYHALLAFFGK